MLSPYEFWQVWRNTADADVGRFLKLYTELPVAECDRLGGLGGSEINAAKATLANEVTGLCHGADAAAAAESTARLVFEEGGVGEGLPTIYLRRNYGTRILELIVRAGLAQSNNEAKTKIKERSVRINDRLIVDGYFTVSTNDNHILVDAPAFDSSAQTINIEFSELLISVGKKRHALVRLEG